MVAGHARPMRKISNTPLGWGLGPFLIPSFHTTHLFIQTMAAAATATKTAPAAASSSSSSSNGVVANGREGVKSYYKNKIEQLEQVVSDRQQVRTNPFYQLDLDKDKATHGRNTRR